MINVNRWALWQVLKYYKVHSKLVSLLADLHSATQAAVRLGGQMGEWFGVDSGVRQGCVIAPLLFNIFIDFVVKQALLKMPEGCGVKVEVRGRGGTAQLGGQSLTHEVLAILLYADDMVLMAHDPVEMAEMLRVMDEVTLAYGMCINAGKTEIMVLDPAGTAQQGLGPSVVLSGGPAKNVEEFKYLGGWVDSLGTCAKEVSARAGKALGVFQGFKGVWDNKYMKLADKLVVYRAFVMPHLLYGVETWNMTKAQIQQLEVVHSACLRTLIGAKRSEHRTLMSIREQCGMPSLELIIIQRTLQWLGHVARMEPHRYPHIALFGDIVGGKRGRGRPRQTHRHTYEHMFERVGLGTWKNDTWFELAQDRDAWRKTVKGLQIVTPAPRKRDRPYLPREAKRARLIP
jgi:hypothetical protein